MRRAGAYAWLLGCALGAAYLITEPPGSDLTAAVFRSELFEREGFTAYSGQWYAGHHTPGYSLLAPPLSALLGPRLLGALAALASIVLFERLARRGFGPPAWVATCWFAVGIAANLWVARVPFGLGVALGLGALLAAQRDRPVPAGVLAGLTGLASPVAGAFVALAGVAWAAASRPARGRGIGLAAAALVPVALVAAAFPEGGTMPFVASSFWPALAVVLAVLVLLPREQHVLRAGAALYAALLVAVFVLPNPLGGSAVRLGVLFAGPLLAGALLVMAHPGRWRLVALASLVLPLTFWAVRPAWRDQRLSDDPVLAAGFHTPLLEFLRKRQEVEGPLRVEVAPTRYHAEAAVLAPEVPLARGWERQLELKHAPLFYNGGAEDVRGPSPGAYRAWLYAHGVSYVAIPQATADYSARAERRLGIGGSPYLRPVWRGGGWRVWEVRGSPGLASGSARLSGLGADWFALSGKRPGATTVRLRFTPYWAVVRGDGCVERGPGGFTRVRLRRAGGARVAIRMTPWRAVEHGPRCT